MKASVVVCAYSLERLADIGRAVDSLLRQTHEDREIVLAVDNNRELYHRLGQSLPRAVVLALNERERGLSPTRNAGVRASSGDVIAFMDDDAVAREDWIERQVSHYADPLVAGVGGRALPAWEDEPARWLPEELYWAIGCTYAGYGDGVRPVRNVHGNTMSFRREVFERVGLFSSVIGHNRNLLGGEETEFCLRIAAAMPEARLVYDPEVLIFHKVPRERCTAGHLLRRAYGEGVSKALIRRAAADRTAALSDESRYLKRLATACPRRILRLLLRGHAATALAQGSALFLAVSGTGVGYALTRARLALRRNGGHGH